MKMLVALALFASSVAAPATFAPPALDPDKIVGTSFGVCADGSMILVEVYDPNPSDPAAAYIAYRRESGVVGILDAKTKVLHVTGARVSLPLDDAMARWPSPCDLPSAGPGI